MPRERVLRRQWQDPTAWEAISRNSSGKPTKKMLPKLRNPGGQRTETKPELIASGKEAPVSLTIERRRKEIELIMGQLQTMRQLGFAGTGDYAKLGNELRRRQLQQAQEVK